MNKIRRGVALMLLFVLCVQVLSGCGAGSLAEPQREVSIDLSEGFTQAPSQSEMTKISENDRFVLYADFANGEAAVEDKRNNYTWYTNPVDKSEDGLASGFHKNALQSVITVVYTTNLSVDMTCGGFLSSVRKDGLSYRLEEDGSVIFLFDFPNEAFTIPVRYSISADSFTAEILSDGIREYGTNTIKTIDLLPFFGAGGREDEGYMLVPDGSGALIYYNNNRLTANTYTQTVYGFDNGTNDKMMGGKAASSYFTVSENQYLPVFGVHQNNQGFLAVVTQGAARAGINANVAYKYTLYNTVWTTYQFRSIGTVRQTQKDGSENIASIAEKKTETWQNFQVSYYFLEAGNSEYPDMAEFYRNYLVENWGLEARVTPQESIPLYLDLYGYIEKTKSLMGIPVEKKIPMTTVEDINAILDELEDDDISHVVLKYNFWAKNSYFGKIPTTASVDAKVGTSEQLLALQDRLAENGGALYLSADLMNVYKSGNGINEYADALRSVANTTQRQYQFSLASAAIDTRYDAWYLLRPASVPGVFETFAGNLTGADYRNLALDAVGQMLYSELGSSGAGRNQVLQIMRDAVGTVAEKADGLMLTGANEYVAVLASHILETPAKASCYDLEDVSVPFYQMVFHGYVSYSLGASNLASNPADMTLKCLEYGAYPMYSLIAQNADELIGSRMDSLYSADVANWLDFMTEQYRQLNEALCGIQGSTISDHRIISENVRMVAYDNGTVLYINYGEQAVSADGIRLESKGYAVVSDGSVVASGKAVGAD